MNLTPINPKRVQHNTRFLLHAAGDGRVEDVRQLIPLSSPGDNNSAALGAAARNGHAPCVELLIPVSDGSAQNHQALRWAADGGHLECVKLLVLGATEEGVCVALQGAVVWGHMECVDFLYDMCNPEQVLRALLFIVEQNPENGLCSRAVERWQRVMVEKQKGVLSQVVDGCGVRHERKI